MIELERKVQEYLGALSSLVIFVLFSGTIFYHHFEGWGWLDSLYFCVMTLTTVGYGDFYPTTPISKIFTMVYVLVGIGIIFAFIRFMSKRND